MPLDLQLFGSSFVLFEGGGLFWPSEKILFLADTHLGKGAAFRNRMHSPVPPGTSQATLQKLTTIIQSCEANQIVILGDLWHHAAGCDLETIQQMKIWMRQYRDLDFLLVEGNHDRRTERYEKELGIRRIDRFQLGSISGCHDPAGVQGPALAGHLHPAIQLRGRGRQSEKFPCLWLNAAQNVAVLPAFGEFTGSVAISAQEGDEAWIVTRELVKKVL